MGDMRSRRLDARDDCLRARGRQKNPARGGRRRQIALLGAAVLGPSIVACTLLGAGVGAVVDANRDPGPPSSIPGWDVVRVKLGQKLVLWLNDGSVVRGEYAGTTRSDDDGVPSKRVVTVNTSDGLQRTVGIADIDHVEVYPEQGDTAMVAGAVIGLAVDIIVVAVAVSSADDRSERDRQASDGGGYLGQMSCPLVYGFDGETYHFDAEVFGGAIMPSLQRTDVVVLEHARETAGQLRVRVTNELSETEFVDSLSLIVADHAPDTRVIPNQNGELRTIGTTKPPRAAHDLRNHDVLASLREADDRWWFGNPFGRSPARDEDLRDGVVLEFDRPSGVATAKLVLRLRNTTWGSHLQGQLGALPPPVAHALARELEQSPAARDAVNGAMLREGMLRVQVSDAQGAWQPAGHVWEVSPLIPRDVAVDLPLGPDGPGPVRVRLDAGVGLWMIDAAGIDYATTPPPAATQLTAVQATGRDGADHLGELAQIDGRRLTMVRDDTLELRFNAPPRAVGLSRTVLIAGTGWYQIHAEHDPLGPPVDLAFLHRVIAEPGFYARWSLDLLDKHVQRVMRPRVRP